MALNVKCVTLTQAGTGTGAQTIELGDNFDPVCGIVLAAPVAANGIVAHQSFSVGFFSFRGGVVQQCYTASFSEDAAATSDTYSWQNTDGVAALMDANGAKDMAVTFTGLTTGVGADVTFNITNAHTTASVRLFVMVFGGSDVLDAEVHTITPASGAVDVALSAGFGHPDVVFLASDATNNSNNNVPFATLSLGFGVRGGSSRGIAFVSDDAAATEATFQRINNNAAVYAGTTPELVATLAAEAGWPTDGYEVNFSTMLDAAERVNGLAIRFSANVTVASGEGAARTTIGTTDLAVGTSTPKGLLLLHTRQATANTSDSTSTDAAMFGVGMCGQDGVERWVGGWDDDAQATASVASSAQSDVSVMRTYAPSTDALDGDADASIVGSAFRINWTDAAPAAHLYEWVAFGEVAAAAARPRQRRSVTARRSGPPLAGRFAR